MPYKITTKDDGGKFCVSKSDTGLTIKGGCHSDRKAAVEHLQAIMASETAYAIEQSYIEEVEDTEFSGDNFEFSDGMKEFAWAGPIVFENVLTGDNRIFKSDSITWEPETLPWVFRWQRSSGQGHAGSVAVGRVDGVERKEDGSIHGFGVIIPDLNEEAAEYLRLLQADVASSVSVDGDSAIFSVIEAAEEGGQQRVEFSSMRLRALSAVDVAAFNGARIKLIDSETEDEVPSEELPSEDSEELAHKKPFPFEKKKVKDEDSEEDPEEDSEEDAKDKKKKKKFPWDKDKMSAESEELAMMREELAKKRSKKKKKMSYGWSIDEALVASAIPVLPSTEAFQEPHFEGPSPLTVTKDGQLRGYLALFNSCHIGFPRTCTKPPKGSNYQYFHTGQIETAEGDLVEVGRLTFKTGHAEMSSSPRVAAEHYDNTGTVAADVRVGEDKFGIWVVGAMRPHLSEADIREFRAAPLSGDWRRIAGRLELVGCLSVNIPGFPVPRIKALVASGETETLFTFLEDDDEEFTISDYELDLLLDKKAELAHKVAEALGEDELIEDDIPDALTKKEIEEKVKNYTKNQLFEDLKEVRELLDDPGAEMSKKVRDGLEALYGLVIKADESGKKFSYNGFDLDIVDGSGLGFEEWEAELEFSGLDIQEFYNTCHGDDGRFCPGSDGPGRVRDNVKGRHPISGNPHLPGKGGKEAGDSDHRHERPFKKDEGKSGGDKSGGDKSGGDKSGGVDSRAYENYLITRKRALGWSIAAGITAAALDSPVAGFLQGLAQAGGVAILGSPAILTLIFTTGVYYGTKNILAARKHRAEYNRQVSRKLARDKLNDRQKRERERLNVTT